MVSEVGYRPSGSVSCAAVRYRRKVWRLASIAPTVELRTTTRRHPQTTI